MISRTISSPVPTPTDILDKFDIPHDGGKIDLDGCAKMYGARIDNDELINAQGQRAIAVSMSHGSGWSTWNQGAISPVDGVTNLIVMTVRDHREELFRATPFGFQKSQAWPLYFSVNYLLGRDIFFPALEGIAEVEIVWEDRETEFMIEDHFGKETLTFIDYMV